MSLIQNGFSELKSYVKDNVIEILSSSASPLVAEGSNSPYARGVFAAASGEVTHIFQQIDQPPTDDHPPSKALEIRSIHSLLTPSPVQRISWSARSKLNSSKDFRFDLCLVGQDNTCYVASGLSSSTQSSLLELKGHTANVNDAKYLERDDRVVSVSDDLTIRLWSVETGQELSQLQSMLDHSSLSPHSITFNPSNQDLLAVGFRSGKICLFDLRIDSPVLHLFSDYHLTEIDWSPFDAFQIGGSAGGRWNVWSLPKAKSPLEHQSHKACKANKDNISVWSLAKAKVECNSLEVCDSGTVRSLSWLNNRSTCLGSSRSLLFFDQ